MAPGAPIGQRLWPTLALVLAVLGAGGCEDKKSFGAPCTADDECKKGLCVAGVDGDQAVCTRSCANAEDCPEGWSCSSVTQNQVLVCSHRPATPFGGAGGTGGSTD